MNVGFAISFICVCILSLAMVYLDYITLQNVIPQEAEKVSSVLEQVAPDLVKFDSPCEVLKGLAEVIRVSDVEFLSLELHRLLRRYGHMQLYVYKLR